MNGLKNILFVGSVMLPAFLFSQVVTAPEDTSLNVLKIEEIHIKDISTLELVYYVSPLAISKEDIEALQSDDVGGLVAKLSGTNVKTYGGLGGLKSVSVRGLGGEHTATVIDGFRLNNTQTGQLNLGQLQADGLMSVRGSSAAEFFELLPVSAILAGNYIEMSSFMTYSGAVSNFKSVSRLGSFGRMETYAQGRIEKKDWKIGAYAKYREAQGNYPFQYTNGITLVDAQRNNNQYQDVNFGASAIRKFDNKSEFKFIYRGAIIDQQLPGSVIFYNETADEVMKTSDHQFMLNYRFLAPNGNGRVYLNGGKNQLQYIDSTYLNNAGNLHEVYNNYSITAGYIENHFGSKLNIKWGVEQVVDVLSSNREDLGTPIRSTTYLLGGGLKNFRNFSLSADLGGQIVYDENQGETATQFQFTPIAKVSREFKSGLFKVFGWYKRTLRMPSFNELYFGSVGNSDLLPERAHQSNLGMKWLIKHNYYNNNTWQIDADVFFNSVQDKIVAIPAKNLFIWTIQNVKNVHVYGGTVGTKYAKKIKNIETRVFANYTWQRVIDVTPDAITNGHQIAYAPQHVGNIDLSATWKDLTLNVSNNAVSNRYALNENIATNLLKGFWTTDLSLGYDYTKKSKHKLGISLSAKNLANVQYAFIRSYAMPGRHYLLALSYEIL